jgi:hypothetical protein
MQADAGMGQQPPMHRGCLVRGEIVADHVDGQAGLGLPFDLVQEVAEVDGPVQGRQLADHFLVAVFSAAKRSMVPCRT